MVLNENSDVNSEDRLLLCIQQGDNDEAKTILQDLNSSDIVDDLGNTLLHFSSECGNTVMTKYLIDMGYDVNAVNSHGNTSLILALQRDNDDIVNNHGITSLILALQQADHADIVRILLEVNASVLISNNQGDSAAKYVLHEQEVKPDILRLFLQKFKEECSNDSLKIAKELLKANCTLSRAVVLQDTAVTTYLLENGFSIDHPDPGYFGSTALHVAVRESDYDNVVLLITRGADLNAEDDCGRSPIYFVKNKVILETLLNHGAQFVTDDGMLRTDRPFRWGEETIEILRRYELDFSAKEEAFGDNVLHLLLLNENLNCVEFLKEKIGDSFNINEPNNQGFTPLMYASLALKSDVFEFLLQRGADVNIEDTVGNTALTYALTPCKNKTRKKAQKQILMLLLQHGANIQTINNHQLTLFDYIQYCKTFDLAKVLIAHLVLMEDFGFKINDVISDKIDSHMMFKNYYNLCKTRIEKMKQTIICEPVSLFKLFMASEKKIASFACNKKLISKLQYMMHYKHGFELYYYQVLRKNIVKIVKQAAALQQTEISIV